MFYNPHVFQQLIVATKQAHQQTVQIIKMSGDEFGNGYTTFPDGGVRLLQRLAVPRKAVVLVQIPQESSSMGERLLPSVL